MVSQNKQNLFISEEVPGLHSLDSYQSARPIFSSVKELRNTPSSTPSQHAATCPLPPLPPAPDFAGARHSVHAHNDPVNGRSSPYAMQPNERALLGARHPSSSDPLVAPQRCTASSFSPSMPSDVFASDIPERLLYSNMSSSILLGGSTVDDKPPAPIRPVNMPDPYHRRMVSEPHSLSNAMPVLTSSKYQNYQPFMGGSQAHKAKSLASSVSQASTLARPSEAPAAKSSGSLLGPYMYHTEPASEPLKPPPRNTASSFSSTHSNATTQLTYPPQKPSSISNHPLPPASMPYFLPLQAHFTPAPQPDSSIIQAPTRAQNSFLAGPPRTQPSPNEAGSPKLSVGPASIDKQPIFGGDPASPEVKKLEEEPRHETGLEDDLQQLQQHFDIYKIDAVTPKVRFLLHFGV